MGRESRQSVRILLIEDDSSMAKLVRLVLSEAGYAVDVTHSGEEGRILAMVHDYDGIILDLGLADQPGTDVLRALRKAGRATPVLVFTGRDESESVVRLLDAGADEYVVKPVTTQELRARVGALVRRGAARGRTTERLLAGNIMLDRPTRRVWVGEAELPLTPRELALLQHLMLQVGEVVPRSELLEKVWDMHFDPGSNVVDVHVGRLRRKLEAAGATATITARRGLGFVLTARGAAGTPARPQA